MKKEIFKNVLLILIASISVGYSLPGDKQKTERKRPVNIILFIGDGMGTAQVSAAIAASDNTLVFEEFPYSGFLKTSSSDQYVTDSAAAGTAMASGVKTKNGMIGMSPDSAAVASIMEYAKKNGLSTGLVSTSSITHATPASFIAHNSGRGNYEDIANDFMSGGIDVFIGGGADHFIKRADGRDLTVGLKSMGYDVVFSLDAMKNSRSGKLAALLAPVHLARPDSGRAGMLEQMTAKAISSLSKNKKGFVLMVEASQIDWAGHANDLIWSTSEVLDLSYALMVAFDYAKKMENTLVVATADHETGGLSLIGLDENSSAVKGNYGTIGHSATMVPLFSYGPGAENFSGIHENTFIFEEFMRLLKLRK